MQLFLFIATFLSYGAGFFVATPPESFDLVSMLRSMFVMSLGYWGVLALTRGLAWAVKKAW